MIKLLTKQQRMRINDREQRHPVQPIRYLWYTGG
jgi:hypothetical protein